MPILKNIIDNANEEDTSDIKAFISQIEKQEKEYYERIKAKDKNKDVEHTSDLKKLAEKNEEIQALKDKIVELETTINDNVSNTPQKTKTNKIPKAPIVNTDSPQSQKSHMALYVLCEQRNPILQKEYRNKLVDRFKSCIVTKLHSDLCEACHIIPFNECENFDINNGLILNPIIHKLFDIHHLSINPLTSCIEINNGSEYYDFMKEYENKKIKILSKFPIILKNLKEHYEIFKNNY